MEFLEDPQYEQEVVRQGVWFIVLVHLRRLDSVALNLRPCQMLATFQSNILQHCWAQHVAYVWPPCYDVLQHVGSNLKTVKFFVQHFGGCMMLHSFGHVHATLLH